jgi:hypothetical protein
METGPVLFVLFLLFIGILLILFVRKGLREQASYRARLASAARMPRLTAPRAPGPAAAAVAPPVRLAREQPAMLETLSVSSVRAAFEKFFPEDPWRNMNAARVSEAFEEFTRKR